MVGTILSNFWVALFGFSIYFFSSYPFLHPTKIIVNASIIAIILFFLTFVVRAIISFVLEEPNNLMQDILTTDSLKTVETNEQQPSSEKYANIVKSMLTEDVK